MPDNSRFRLDPIVLELSEIRKSLSGREDLLRRRKQGEATDRLDDVLEELGKLSKLSTRVADLEYDLIMITRLHLFWAFMTGAGIIAILGTLRQWF
jgi:hypothetical protein